MIFVKLCVLFVERKRKNRDGESLYCLIILYNLIKIRYLICFLFFYSCYIYEDWGEGGGFLMRIIVDNEKYFYLMILEKYINLKVL